MTLKRRLCSNASVLPLTLFAHFVAILVITLVFVWLFHFREGIGFSSTLKAKIFNLHPLQCAPPYDNLKSTSNAHHPIMTYKTVPGIRKAKKVTHLILHFLAIVAGTVGIYAVFKFHNERRIPHMYSLHSWLGLSTICLFGLQWLFSFFSFWYPKAPASTRARLAPWHAVIGMIIFFMAILSAETGLVEKFLFIGLQKNQEALVVNFTGLLIFVFAVSVGITVLIP